MGLIRRTNKLLECFYCGRKSKTRFNGQPSFECKHCTATNYLDEHGDITDPPASAMKEPSTTSPSYATTSRLSQPARRSETIFCETCLNNQRLLTVSIAQYLPDDPDAPDYAQREQEYYDFRRRLEKVYPQICADCEPKVRQRIERAAYTAKTDVLRHMIDHSKPNKVVTKHTWLDVFHLVGKWLWLAGFVMEILSHILAMSSLRSQYCATHESAPLDCSFLQRFSLPFNTLLPEHGRLVGWSFYAALFSLWWNPRFVQTVRGFTKHLLGLHNWYIYQLMGVGIRYYSGRFFGSRRLDLMQECGAHLLLLAIAVFLYYMATTCIRVDTTPLFGAKSKMQTPQADSPEKITNHQPAPKPDGVKNMSDLLDEILDSPTVYPPALPRTSYNRPNPLLHGPNAFGSHASTSSTSLARKPSLDLNNFSLSESGSGLTHHEPTNHFATIPPPRAPQPSGEEMDWSPSTSLTPTAPNLPRAFTSFRDPSDPDQQTFNTAPTQEKRGAFWYRVPPAPVSPAARLFQEHPSQPRLRGVAVPSGGGGGGASANGGGRRSSSSSGIPEIVSFREATNRASAVAVVAQDEGGEEGEQPAPSVTFAKPSFFPPAADDPRDGLAEMLGQGFRLSQEEQERRGWMGGLFGGRK
ncbi:Ima1 N-terminal domain-containing protein [Coniochaeta sp. 2T2.1]|nr:Ima1 N-terminal domain-containing protein [Coniochaeta sp. 2T2.1]